MRAVLGLGAIIVLGGCSTMDFSKSEPALLAKSAGDIRPALKDAVSKALGGRRVALASNVLTTDSRLIIEPKMEPRDPFGNPMSGRLLGRPDHFILKTANGECALMHEKTGEYYPLPGVACLPV